MTSGLPTGLFIFSLVLIFVGERLFGDDPTVRFIVDGLGLVALAGSIVLRRQNKGGATLPPSVRRISQFVTGGVIVGLLLYIAQTPDVIDRFDWSADFTKAYDTIVSVGWAIVLGCSALAQIFLDASLLYQGRAPAIEERRVRGAVQTALSVGLLLSVFAVVNYTASVKEADKDLSLQQVGRPSDAVLEIVRTLDDPIYLSTFFPPENEVYDEIKPYLATMEREADGKIVLLNYDHAFAPKVADNLGIRDNGHLVFSKSDPRGQRPDEEIGNHPRVNIPNEKLRLGLDRQRARVTLKKFDAEMQKRLLKTSRGNRRVYFTSGHGERDYRGTPRDPDDQRGRLRILNAYLKSQSYQLRQLSAADGLVNEVPAAAGAVVIAGATEPFLEAEEDAMIRYFDNGGRLFIFLEPGNPAPEKLLEHLGIQFDQTYAANLRTHVPLRRAPQDRYYLVTKRVSSHASVTGLARSSEALAMPLTGTLTKIDGTKQNIQFTIKSMSGTFLDKNENYQMDRDDGENTGQYNFAAAVEYKPPKPEGAPEDAPEPKSGRAIVVGSAEVASDFWLKFRGNGTLVDNGFKWLVGEEELSVTIKEIPGEDVAIQHSKGVDTVLFYGTIFFVPALVLGGGLTFVSRSRRKRG